MNWWIYMLVCAILGFVLFIVTIVLDKITYFDLIVDGERINGCRCIFYDWQGYLKIENPDTGRVIICRFKYYSIEKVYFKHFRKEDSDDDI